MLYSYKIPIYRRIYYEQWQSYIAKNQSFFGL